MAEQNSSGKIQDPKQSLLNEAEREEVKKEVTAILREEIRADVWRWCRKWFIWVVGIVGIVGFLVGIEISIPKIEKKADEYITNSITQKFSEPNIQKTLQTVASQQAKFIITEQITPEVEKAKQNIVSFQAYLSGMKKEYDGEYQELFKQVTRLEKREELFELTDEAINKGDRKSYETLVRMSEDTKQEEDVRNAAFAQMFQVKRFYLGSSRVNGIDSLGKIINGEKVDVKLTDFSTRELLETLSHNQEFMVRAVVANFLKNRREKGVPEALLKSALIDDNLIVVNEALTSFDTLTGHQSRDVFGDQTAFSWWEGNKAKIEPQLKDRSKDAANNSGK